MKLRNGPSRQTTRLRNEYRTRSDLAEKLTDSERMEGQPRDRQRERMIYLCRFGANEATRLAGLDPPGEILPQ